MARYTARLRRARRHRGQVLLTAEDLMRRSRHTNALRALDRLLDLGVVPSSTRTTPSPALEIRFGDNDRLAALVTHLVRADALVLLSDVESLYTRPPEQPGATPIPRVRRPAGPRRRDHRHAPARPALAPAAWPPRSRRPPSPPAPASLRWSPPPPTPPRRWRARTWAPGSPSNGARKPVRLLWLAHLAAVQGRLLLDDGAVKAVRRPPHLAAPGRHLRRATALRGRRRRRDGRARRHRHRPRPGQLLRGRTAADARAAPPRNWARRSAADTTVKLFTLTTWCWSKPRPPRLEP